MQCTVQQVLKTHFAAYAQQHKLPAYVHRAAYWLSRCRTADLGGHMRRCPEGHVERAFYNSCHQRGCPQCQALATEQWLQRQRSRLLACAHHHLIFTIPHELNALWCWNRAVLAKLLFATVRAVLFELLEDPRYLGATPAFISALHTWGRSLSLHPHVHVLIADGGLSEGAWTKARRSHFLPARVVMMVFRGKLLDALARSLAQGKLRIPPDTTRERLRSLFSRLGRKKWNVHIRARYAHGDGVAAYLARYLKGGPLKNTQLLALSNDCVAFHYRPHHDEDDAGERTRVMQLTPDAFLARYLAHLPVPRLQAVRGYGLYGQRSKLALDVARATLGQPPVETAEPISASQFLSRFTRTDTTGCCPRCGARLVFTSLAPNGTGPPYALH